MSKFKRFFIGWVAVVLCLILGTTALAQRGARTASTDIFARNYTASGTNLVAYELTNLITSLPTSRKVRMHIDGGAWTINTNVSFTTNITLIMYPGCPFNVSTGIVMTFTNNPLVAADWPIFTGLGTATGSCDMVYRWPSWGDQGRFSIGDGILTNVPSVYLLTSALSNAMTNVSTGYANLDIDGTDDLLMNEDGTNWIKAAVLDTNVGVLAQSYIAGCHPRYLSSTSITVTAGDGYCNGNYFKLSEQAHNMTSLTTTQAVHYLYINNGSSVYPTNIALVDTTNVPAYNTALAGWYYQTNRTISAIYSSSGTNTIRPFSYNNGDYIFGSGWFWLGQAMATTGLWTNPTTQASSYYLPANAKEALVNLNNGPGPSLITNANDLISVVITSQEAAYLAPGMINTNGGVMGNSGIYRTGAIGWIALGPSRNVWYSGAADDPDNLNMSLNGYRINR